VAYVEDEPLAVEEVECPTMDHDWPGEVMLVEHDPETHEIVGTYPVEVRRGFLRFRPPNAEVGLGSFVGRGLAEPAWVVWAQGVCTEPVELAVQPHFAATVRAVGDLDAPYSSIVRACPEGGGAVSYRVHHLNEGDQTRYEDFALEGCEVYVKRHHGSLQLRGEIVPLRTDGGEQDVVLEVPELPATGLGGYVEPALVGVRIDAVAPGSRADLAGLETRDVVLLDAPPRDLAMWLDSEEELSVFVDRDGERFELTF